VIGLGSFSSADVIALATPYTNLVLVLIAWLFVFGTVDRIIRWFRRSLVESVD